ncbi:excinuclease ABC subunit A [Candidatus Campbellbacteria bacterium CG10_big_fil_rev_8_21_14_0_10_35_52]|uniref:UvrABC system protein A n=1 Tax=Candidatus Campbellbacteria bacterium CG10_big_fil_rev_8_21_14_0_10_35_52 TaxID=1974527 RepID=A0A2M6WV01_9BACT|nr:MAG: excinuclease ABC subunit A [Candidatus Campbellbacteria bacterium CG10_big_fil_rev_8_21_14_0_10_35_52]
MEEKIIVKGARTHNLKNITVEIPRNKMIVFTGLSGSGKSSLAFDTIFAEGQRRYIESLSAYARQFLRQMQKPDVDEIVGLSPAISIDQKSRSNNPRSTVATITEIYDYLRVLYARIGKLHCLKCGREIKKLSNEEIIETVLKTISARQDKGALKIFAPIVVGRKGEYYQLLYDLLGKGYGKVKIDGNIKNLREQIILSKTKKHSIDVLVDEIFINEFKDNETNALERLREAIEKALEESDGLLKIEEPNGEEKIISAKFMCPYDSFSFPEVEPRLFSFNSPYGACEVCNGLGTKYFFGSEVCETCGGARLRKEALSVYLGKHINIVDLTNMSIKSAYEFFNNLKLTKKEKEISKVVVKEITNRLRFMLNVGIDYLTLNRRANTLSGGEAQRIRLASQLGSGLVGALYVLDEPTIGLHQHDNARLIKTLLNLRDLGNTIIIVEHDEDTIYSSDYIVDLGIGAGTYGGEIVVSGYLEKLLTAKKNESKSLTLDYLRGEKKIELPKKRRDSNKGIIKIRGGKKFNIKNMTVDIPLGRFIAITGVSGSGKSTFLYEILHKNLRARFEKKYRSAEVYNVASISGTEYIGRSILIDQSPIGRTPRSNPATYTGAFTFIRDLFASTTEARARGWKASRFSFNVKGGRCEVCNGNGTIAVEMHFLPTVYVKCDICGGKRFMKETLEIKYKHKNIYEVLEMTVEKALKFFEDIPAIYDRLKTLNEVGLGYLELGQSATTLSGGEAQRVKISSELYRPHIEKTIYLLDEPTIGLHYEDVKKLIEILQSLVARGNTVAVIEHNMDIIKSADWVIDIGPEGGDKGGLIVAKGTPEEVAESKKSYTGQYLKKALKLD